jgi:hypothetical protein
VLSLRISSASKDQYRSARRESSRLSIHYGCLAVHARARSNVGPSKLYRFREKSGVARNWRFSFVWCGSGQTGTPTGSMASQFLASVSQRMHRKLEGGAECSEPTARLSPFENPRSRSLRFARTESLLFNWPNRSSRSCKASLAIQSSDPWRKSTARCGGEGLANQCRM